MLHNSAINTISALTSMIGWPSWYTWPGICSSPRALISRPPPGLHTPGAHTARCGPRRARSNSQGGGSTVCSPSLPAGRHRVHGRGLPSSLALQRGPECTCTDGSPGLAATRMNNVAVPALPYTDTLPPPALPP